MQLTLVMRSKSRAQIETTNPVSHSHPSMYQVLVHSHHMCSQRKRPKHEEAELTRSADAIVDPENRSAYLRVFRAHEVEAESTAPKPTNTFEGGAAQAIISLLQTSSFGKHSSSAMIIQGACNSTANTIDCKAGIVDGDHLEVLIDLDQGVEVFVEEEADDIGGCEVGDCRCDDLCCDAYEDRLAEEGACEERQYQEGTGICGYHTLLELNGHERSINLDLAVIELGNFNCDQLTVLAVELGLGEIGGGDRCNAWSDTEGKEEHNAEHLDDD